MQKKAKMSLEKRHNLTGWAFLIPAALLIFIFCFYPMVQALILSFSKKGTGGSTFAGLANYQRILKDKTFQQCLFNTIFYFYNFFCYRFLQYYPSRPVPAANNITDIYIKFLKRCRYRI